MNRRDLLLGAGALATTPALLPSPAKAQADRGMLRVAMTTGDIPLTTGQPSQGAEGNRFLGITLYDPLIAWDLSKADAPPALKPALALSWAVDPADTRRWTFQLRPGVAFHDGSAFTAESVAWNLAKLLDRDAPQFDRQQAAQGSLWIGSIARWAVRGPLTIEIETRTPDAVLPFSLANVFFSSPARWEALGRSWERFAEKPSGTGPYIADRFIPRQRLEAVRNTAYWDPARIPKHERLALIPMPDALTRTAALLSGQVDLIEAPPPDAAARIRAGGGSVVTNVYPHNWCFHLSFVEGSPFRDLRIRKAANLAIDRDGIVGMLAGMAAPAAGMVTKGHPWFGTPSFEIRHDPDQARRLLAEAGFGPRNPVKVRLIISPSGSGQMQPLPMNEAIQQNLRAVGIEVEFDVMDWEALRARRRAGAEAPENRGCHGINNSWAFWDPDIGLLGPAQSTDRRPGGFNWGHFIDPEADALAIKARATFDPEAQRQVLAALHARIVDQAMWLWVVHDVNPRGLARRVKGFVQAQSWYQDLTPITLEG
ncbi:ABC transporter substrate-binding protein [Paeniroseomonas aquatica]|uniref:ABC transporter substrate-binding protein n=1 Tax=Paeniroseomonas aquatica TaxID=373043 RepID=A0ABT8ACR0_9PROT|nr:ABC transporter substrate-binding protein [Paeniroseomonas aquatica]MDN3567552.1 ABC transporter substrate-binding protein [Paeniroseomonas aquatica]